MFSTWVRRDYVTVLTSKCYGKLFMYPINTEYFIRLLRYIYTLYMFNSFALFSCECLSCLYIFDGAILIYFWSKHYSLFTIQFIYYFYFFWVILWFLCVSDLFLFHTCCVYCWSRLASNMIGDLGVQHLSQDGLRHCPNLQNLW